jgi:addiction module HigA family antidote
MDARMLIHPGEVLKEEFLVPYGLSANRLALAIGVPPNRITSIINGERGITGETAMLLGHAFNTTPEFWVNMQVRYELDVAKSKVRKESIRLADEFARGLVRASP